MSGWALAGPALWVIAVTPLCVLLAAGRRHRDRQATQRARALQARRRTPARARTNQHRRTR